jgi:translation initiation factor 2 beta subunit (eIF-2beta)/eIF-5
MKNNKIQPTLENQAQKMQAIIEQAEADRKKYEEQREVDRKQTEEMRKRLEELEKQIATAPAPVQNVTQINVQQVNITLNTYNKPDLSRVVTTVEDAAKSGHIFKYVYQQIFANPSIPENHVVYIPNKKDMVLSVHDAAGWRSITSEIEENDVVNCLEFFVSKVIGELAYSSGLDPKSLVDLLQVHREITRTRKGVKEAVLSEALNTREIVAKTKALIERKA